MYVSIYLNYFELLHPIYPNSTRYKQLTEDASGGEWWFWRHIYLDAVTNNSPYYSPISRLKP